MYKEAILHVVDAKTAVKNVDLALAVMERVNPTKFELEKYQSALEELVETGEIINVDYTLESMDYRTKSIYFPKGTVISQ